MAFESLILRTLLVGILVGAPRWKKMRPKTASACMNRAPSREFQKVNVDGEGESLSSEFVEISNLIKDSCYGSGSALRRIEGDLSSSKECQVVASVIQLALTNDLSLVAMDQKLEQEKLGLSADERDHVDKAFKEILLDRSRRRNKDLLGPVYLLLYAQIHDKIASEDLVVAGSGNTHSVLLSPDRLKEKVCQKNPAYLLYNGQR